jgi:hypothetical protein
MGHWPLTGSQVLTAAILGLMLVVLIALPFEKARVTRKEFTRLQNDVKRLSEDIKGLQVAELRRCIVKHEASIEGDQMSIAAPQSPISASAPYRVRQATK